ncbi:DUF4843 domain-containing protein [Parapedobacter tibetensis]|uniref:DUF4843 domain-containing protein n=1 Tax=Parapedobacter tibetensis TaxID=2972951 RepID=UPI00214D1D4E|nr:DUF4843 domain-containing protein [Parapedobacter tibetensis]
MYNHSIKIFLYALAGLLVFGSSCEKAELYTYDHSANIYFDFTDSITGEYVDSITYTFAYDMTKAQDTVYILTRLSGIRVDQTRYYTAYVDQDSSSAIAGEHYEPLQVQYPLQANIGWAYLPLIIYNTADLEGTTVSLIIKLKASDDFGIENPDLIRAKVVFSARLEEPGWWNMWLGAYTRIKHQLFLLVTEQIELSTVGQDAPKNLYFVNLLTMMLNNPVTWVANNPEKGYVLDPVTEGSTAAYHFYHVDNPARTILLRFNAAAGRYYFIDENGEEVR